MAISENTVAEAELMAIEEINAAGGITIDGKKLKIVPVEEDGASDWPTFAEKSKKLIRLTVSLGGDVRRTIFAGIKTAYDPATLVGRLTVVVANLAPRKMKFGISEGMVLAASADDDGAGVYLLEPWPGARPGMRIR